MTVRRLAFEPGPLTRDYLAGRRIPQIPPFRLFLIGVVILLLAGPIDPHPARPHGIMVKASGARGVGKPVAEWLNIHMARAAKDPDRALAEMERWSLPS